MNGGVGCLGSPIDRSIGRNRGSGASPAISARMRSNGYGCSRASSGFTAASSLRLFPAFLAVLGNDAGMDAAAHVEARFELHVSGPHGGGEIAEDLVGHRLVESALVAIRPHVQLERFQLDAKAIGNI